MNSSENPESSGSKTKGIWSCCLGSQILLQTAHLTMKMKVGPVLGHTDCHYGIFCLWPNPGSWVLEFTPSLLFIGVVGHRRNWKNRRGWDMRCRCFELSCPRPHGYYVVRPECEPRSVWLHILTPSSFPLPWKLEANRRPRGTWGFPKKPKGN